MQKKIVKKHPLAIRWFHWLNFPLLSIMIWSGLLIYWANDIYRIGWGSKTLLKFFPDSFYKALHLSSHLARGMSFHFIFMCFFLLMGSRTYFLPFFQANGDTLFPIGIPLRRPGRLCCTICILEKKFRCKVNIMQHNV